jgi:DNA (cytosine-5)-methyltransferase 1
MAEDTEDKAIVGASFFSGIGGLDLGFAAAGVELRFQCERDPFCLEVLGARFPNLPRAEDITNVARTEVPTSDVWFAGFPCQDLSLADPRGRDGLAGRRSGLFFRFLELLAPSPPTVVVLENVPGLLNSHEGRDFANVVHSLVELGYGVGWRVLNSRYFGVPQSRQRLFIVGYHRDAHAAAEVLFEPECGQGDHRACAEARSSNVSPFMEGSGDPRRGPVVPRLSYCLSASTGRHTGNDWSRTYVVYPAKGWVRRMTPEECERLQGFPVGWTLPSHLADRPRIESKRYAALGNAVSVPVAEWLGARIVQTLRARRGVGRSTSAVA